VIGKSLAHYDILDTIGSGGMGEVYRARDQKLGRDVAVKLLPSALRRDEKALARFKREAKALAALNHPNIVTIHSIEEDKEELFLTMELVEGKSLGGLIRSRGMEMNEFLKIAVPLADALAAGHAKGVIHRDLKPSNVMITDAGRVKVLDYGVALVMHESNLTDADMTVGTAAYMSPEQISGGEIDGRSDMFALGIIFYELLSGMRPFRGDHPAAIMYSIVNEEAPRVPGQPESVADVVHRCLEKARGDRFASADELLQALQELATTPATHAESVQSGSPSPEIRAAYDRGDFQEAYRVLHAVQEQRNLSAEELEMLAASMLWISKIKEGVQTREKAYTAYSRSGRNIAAARVALDLVADYIEKGSSTVARGWLRRAERLLQNEPECREHGYLLRRQTADALGKGDFARAMELNRQCGDIAARVSDVDLQVTALHDRGQILIARGDVEEGTDLVDEAMASAVSGELGPFTTGALYCRTMMVCKSIADYHRAREWSEAARRWCEPYTASTFPGVCRVHSAEAMRHQGLWDDAEHAARTACEDFMRVGQENHAGEAFIEIGELALRKGNYQEAEDAFRQAHERGHDPVPGLPLLRLAQGNGRAAQQTIKRALGECADNRLRRAKLLAAGIAIAIANGKLSAAEAAVEELSALSQDFGCRAFQAHALMGRGALELQRGNNNVATPVLREAWSMFNEMGFPYDAARARTLMAEAYLKTGNKEDARLQLEAACKTFGELGAKPDLEVAAGMIKKST
jgi:serine/threonine protein kinase